MACLVVASLFAVVEGTSAGALPFRRFDGGGRLATDCLQVIDVSGVRGPRRAVAARCVDGDPACDADGRADGTCKLRVRLCFADSAAAHCRVETVTGAQLAVIPGLEALAASLEAFAVLMPVAAPDTCTDVADVIVPRRGRRPGRAVVRSTATTSSGRVDRDRLALVCRPGPRPATFATIERALFVTSCTTASCHGASHAGGLGLARGEAFGALVDAAPSNPVARDAGKLRVVPGDVERSFLLAKLVGNLASGEGSRMPFTGAHLPARSIELVRRWIAAGASATAPF